ncbi:glycoside hydrolase family 36 protein [Chitinophaga sp. RAB17]|uniref:glycoside hydrolase family 36 protein n=1 Tax=Chitinophaga sp. RAB17 TaxID=3233049 RepID=UPI003F9100F4
MKKRFVLILCCAMVSLSLTASAEKIRDAKKIVALLKKSRAYCEDAAENRIDNSALAITRSWDHQMVRSAVVNNGKQTIYVNNIVLFEIDGSVLDSNSQIYGEGFQMLSQTGGSLGHPQNIGGYTDEGHYKVVGPHHMPTAYGMFNLTLPGGECLMLAFSSCQRFMGRISFSANKIIVSVDVEHLKLAPGQRVELEDFMALAGTDKNLLYDELTQQIALKHPPIFGKQVPTGWCSWYCYGPSVSQKDIRENMLGFAAKLPAVKYIQIDDGFQPYMGDWLDENPRYGSLESTLAEIRNAGFTPAIWLAPFIAEKKSKLFTEHPDWFVKDSTGQPLNSATVGFGGWRNGPWYVLDGTNPHAQEYLKYVVRTMREKWGVQYFKLDANYWGAIHKGVHYDANATRIEAYRAGMKAILEACDSNTVILGCNNPIWPSLGLITACRTSNDVSRDWNSFQATARENLMRSWQNGKLWYNDPDCLVLGPNGESGTELTANEFLFHATVVHAVGGLMLLGDKYASLSEKQFDIIRKQLPPAGKSARFTSDKFETGSMDMGAEQYYYFLNWDDSKPVSLKIKLKSKSSLENYWLGTDLGVHDGTYQVKDLPPHSALLIKAKTIN